MKLGGIKVHVTSIERLLDVKATFWSQSHPIGEEKEKDDFVLTDPAN
jgi:hypothetical protein